MILTPIRVDTWKFYAISKADHSCFLLDWYNNLPQDQMASAKRLFAIIHNAASSPQGPRLFKTDISHLVDYNHKIYEFIAGKLRLLWFYSPNEKKVIICSLGFRKKDQKTRRQYIDSVIRDKKAYIEAAEKNDITILEE